MSEGPQQYRWREGDEPDVLAMQVRPDNWLAVSQWCHGVMIASDPAWPGNQAVAVGSLDNIASLGYWVVRTEADRTFTVVEPSEFTKTFVHADAEEN